MAKKNSAGFIQKLLKIMLIVPALSNIISHLASMMKSEAALIKRKALYLFIFAASSLVLLFTFWISLMAVLVVYLLSLNISLLISLLLVSIFNFLLLVIACLCITKTKIDPSFPETRNAVKELISG
jgi:hypothetical protein